MLKFISRQLVFGALLAATNLFAAGLASHIVVVVWDGMPPDFIATGHAPAFAQLARQGVVFANHRSVHCNVTSGATDWRQHLLTSTIYLAEGNGGVTKSK